MSITVPHRIGRLTSLRSRIWVSTRRPHRRKRPSAISSWRTRLLCGALWVALVAGWGATPASPSTSAPPVPAAPSEASIPPTDEFNRGTPRGAVRAFLEATARHEYKRAANVLDLRGMSAAEAAERGPILARQLRVVLDNTPMDLDALSDQPEGRREPGMQAGREIVGRVQGESGPVSLTLERLPRDDGVLIWKFSRATVKRVPELYRQFSYGVVGEWLPPVLIETRVMGIALWQWIGLIVLVAASVLFATLVIRPSMPVARWLLARFGLNQTLVGRAAGPSRLLAGLAVFRAGRVALALPVAVEPVFGAIEKLLLVIAVTWLVFRVIETATAVARHTLVSKGETATMPIVDLAQRTLKITVAVFAILMLLEAVGVQVSALVAAIGVGGIGLALAAQRTVENLFGGLTVIGDQPVRVGDFCRFGERQGTVERIGFWSTRLRTPERSVVSVSNAQFVALQIENLSLRDRILFSATLPLRCETTPDQLRWLLVRLRELLYAHPRVDPDPARVRFTGFGPGALNVEVFAYVRTADYEDYLGVREDLCLRIMDIVAAGGTALALPAQTNYSAAEGLDQERAKAAAAEVERWRERGELPMPKFPAERVQALGATLDYPPIGSSQRADRVPDAPATPGADRE